MTTFPQQIAATLRTSRNALIACHVAPDGDCLGASLALALALERVGLRAIVGSADGVPEAFTALPAANRVVTTPPTERFDVGIAIECSTLERAGTFAVALSAAGLLVNIDHHLSNAGYGDLVYWDTTAAAVGEQIHEVIRALGVPIDGEIAQCLLTAIVTDTGSFRFANTSARVLRLAADLVEAGASVHAIVERVYESRTSGSLRLLGMALAAMKQSAEGRIAWTVVTPEMLAAAGAHPEETAGIVGMLRQIRGVQVALIFEVTPEGVRVGIRSRDDARSHVIAETLGGGGHRGAAGFTRSEPLEQVMATTLAEVEKELRRSDARLPSRLSTS